MVFANLQPLSALFIHNNGFNPGFSRPTNPGLKLANAFGVNGQTLWFRLCCAKHFGCGSPL
jgi:hypothetical protein